MTRPRMAAAHSTTSNSYSARSWADKDPVAAARLTEVRAALTAFAT